MSKNNFPGPLCGGIPEMLMGTRPHQAFKEMSFRSTRNQVDVSIVCPLHVFKKSVMTKKLFGKSRVTRPEFVNKLLLFVIQYHLY